LAHKKLGKYSRNYSETENNQKIDNMFFERSFHFT